MKKAGRAGLPAIATKVVELAQAGEPWAIREIGDRLDGKTKVSIDVQHRQPALMSDVELLDLLQAQFPALRAQLEARQREPIDVQALPHDADDGTDDTDE